MDKHTKFIRLCMQYISLKEHGNPFIVWSCKTLKNSKAMMSSDIDDASYYEFTMNGENGDIYVDEYVKIKNSKFNIEDGA